MKRLKNKILKASAYFAGFVAAFSAACLDGRKWIPFAVAFIVSAAWLTLLAVANAKKY